MGTIGTMFSGQSNNSVCLVRCITTMDLTIHSRPETTLDTPPQADSRAPILDRLLLQHINLLALPPTHTSRRISSSSTRVANNLHTTKVSPHNPTRVISNPHSATVSLHKHIRAASTLRRTTRRLRADPTTRTCMALRIHSRASRISVLYQDHSRRIIIISNIASSISSNQITANRHIVHHTPELVHHKHTRHQMGTHQTVTSSHLEAKGAARATTRAITHHHRQAVRRITVVPAIQASNMASAKAKVNIRVNGERLHTARCKHD